MPDPPRSGKSDPDRPADPVSRAREALAAARAQAEARGVRPVRPVRRLPDPGTPDRGSPEPGAGSRAAPEHEAQDPGAAASGAAASGVANLRSPDPQGAAGSAGGGRRPASARPGFAVQRKREDPQQLSAAISGLLEAEGWALAAATGSVFGRWAQIVGADLAAHTTPEALTDGELTVAADSTAWATQVRLLAGQLVRRLNDELGDGTVRRVRVRGPVTDTRRPGEWRVRGGRGPRDTYG